MQLFDTHTHIHTSNWSADWHWFSHDCKGVLGDSWEPSLCESSKWLRDVPSSLNRSTVSLISCEVFDVLKEWMRETCPSQILRQLLHAVACCCMFLHYPFPICTCSWIGTHSVDRLEDSLFRRFFSCRLSEPRPFLPSQGLPVPYAVSARWEPSTQPGGRDSMLFCFSGINPQHSPSTDNGRYRCRWVTWLVDLITSDSDSPLSCVKWIVCEGSSSQLSHGALHDPQTRDVPDTAEITLSSTGTSGDQEWPVARKAIISDHLRSSQRAMTRWIHRRRDDVKTLLDFLVHFEEFQIPYKAPAQVQEARKLQEQIHKCCSCVVVIESCLGHLGQVDVCKEWSPPCNCIGS